MNPVQGKTDASYLDGRIISGDFALTARLLSRARPRWRKLEIDLVSVLPLLIGLGAFVLWRFVHYDIVASGPFPIVILLFGVWWPLISLHRSAHRRLDALTDLVERIEKRHQSQPALIPEA